MIMLRWKGFGKCVDRDVEERVVDVHVVLYQTLKWLFNHRHSFCSFEKEGYWTNN